MKSFTKSEVSVHRAVDNTDPGFALKGFKLRWMSNIVAVRRGVRIWRTLKISQLPKDVVTELKSINPAWEDGDTIRRRDLTLAYASLEDVKSVREENKDSQNANEAIFRGKASHSNSVTSTGSTTLEVTKGKTADEYK